MQRCRIRPVYLLSPSEQTQIWLENNSMKLAGTIVGSVVFWFLVSWITSSMVNFLADENGNIDNNTYRTDALVPMVIKIVGLLIIGYIGMFRWRTNKI